ncbi:MAG: hypothetical protein JSS97_21580, partial [Actinobacteria bacterium]|nr:hypothetical protein [Actinomycetota bacterium]
YADLYAERPISEEHLERLFGDCSSHLSDAGRARMDEPLTAKELHEAALTMKKGKSDRQTDRHFIPRLWASVPYKHHLSDATEEFPAVGRIMANTPL